MELEHISVFLLSFWSIINYNYYKSVGLLSEPQRLLEEVETIDEKFFLTEQKEFSEWCNDNGFEHNKNFLFHGVINGPALRCSAWWSKATKTWALIYISDKKTNIDFYTNFDKKISLTTASSKDSLSLPKNPRAFIQAFRKLSNDQRFLLHNDAVNEIKQKHHVNLMNERQDLFLEITESILEQMAYIKKIPFWYLRGTYWFFVRRNLKVNKRAEI